MPKIFPTKSINAFNYITQKQMQKISICLLKKEEGYAQFSHIRY